jgi:hypothetical protein
VTGTSPGRGAVVSIGFGRHGGGALGARGQGARGIGSGTASSGVGRRRPDSSTLRTNAFMGRVIAGPDAEGQANPRPARGASVIRVPTGTERGVPAALPRPIFCAGRRPFLGARHFSKPPARTCSWADNFPENGSILLANSRWGLAGRKLGMLGEPAKGKPSRRRPWTNSPAVSGSIRDSSPARLRSASESESLSSLSAAGWVEALAFRRCDQPRSNEKCRKEPIPTNPAMSRCPYPGGPRSNPTPEAPGTRPRPCQPRRGGRAREGRSPVEHK